MKALKCSSYDRKPATAGTIAAAFAAAALILFTATSSAGAGGKVAGVKMPA